MKNRPKFSHRVDGLVTVTVNGASFAIHPTLMLEKNRASLEAIIAGEIDDHRQPWWGEVSGQALLLLGICASP
ncbi:MAG TPA: hypothetical protein VE197_15455 [Mycobacterium sp.]|nr:hypothetical protein [Mycobacterium sp.]